MRRVLGTLSFCVPMALSGQESIGPAPLDGLHISWVSEVPAALVRAPATTSASLPWGSSFARFTHAIQIVPDTGQFKDFEYPFCFEQAVASDTRVRRCPLSLELPGHRQQAVGWFVNLGSRQVPVAALFHENRLVGYELFVPPTDRAAALAAIQAALGPPSQETRVIPSVAPLVLQVAYLWRAQGGWVVFQHATTDELRNPPTLVVLAETERASVPEHPVWSGYVRCPLLSSLESAGVRSRCP